MERLAAKGIAKPTLIRAKKLLAVKSKSEWTLVWRLSETSE